jgi:hypothetical protein
MNCPAHLISISPSGHIHLSPHRHFNLLSSPLPLCFIFSIKVHALGHPTTIFATSTSTQALAALLVPIIKKTDQWDNVNYFYFFRPSPFCQNMGG